MRIRRTELLWAIGFGLLLAGPIGLSGCQSKPADGSVVPDSGTISEEHKSKVESRYTERKKQAKQQRAQPKRR